MTISPLQLPTFTHDRRVRPAFAKQDRIKIELGAWFVGGASGAIDEFLMSLSNATGIDGDGTEFQVLDIKTY